MVPRVRVRPARRLRILLFALGLPGLWPDLSLAEEAGLGDADAQAGPEEREAGTDPTPATDETPASDEVPAELTGSETIVVSASLRDEPAFQSARAVSIVDRSDIDERASRATPDALLEEAGVFVQRTNHGGGAPIIRGQLGNRVLLLVDGIRLNNSTVRQGPNQYLNTVDPLVVDRIEVVRGPGSALFGSDALGGTVNVLTEKPRLGGIGAYGSARATGASMDDSAQLGLRLGWSGESYAVLASGSYRHFGDLRGGGGHEQPFTGYDQWSSSAAAVHRPRKDHELALSVQLDSQRDVPRTDRSRPLDFTMFSVQDRRLVYARYSAENLGPLARLSATASYGYQRELLTRYRIDRNQRQENDLDVGTWGLQLTGEVDLAGPLVAGAELYLDDINSSAASGPLTGSLVDDPPGSRYPAGTGYFTTSAFAHHELGIAPSWKLVSELRFGVAKTQIPTDDRLTQLFPEEDLPVLPAVDHLVPVYAGGLHVRWAASPWAALTAGAMLGFRVPNVDDYARTGTEGPGYQIPARSLDPERAASGEIGVKLAPGRAELSAYYAYTFIDDAIARRVTSLAGGSIMTIDGLRILQTANADSARYHSVELALLLPVWARLSAFGGFGWTHGTQTTFDPVAMTSTREPASKTPPAFGTVGLGWRAPERRWFVEGLVRFALDQDRLSELDRGDTRICPDTPGECTGTPGWVTPSLRGGWRFASRLRATVVLENLTDTRYRYHASGVQGPSFGVSGLLEGEL